MCFSVVGKYLSLGFDDGTVAIINIETTHLNRLVCPYSEYHGYVSCLSWQKIHLTEKTCNMKKAWLFGGLNQVESAGMIEYLDPRNGLSTTSKNKDMILQLSGMLLFSMTANGHLCCYILGLYPLFTLKVESSSDFSSFQSLRSSLVYGCYPGPVVFYKHDASVWMKNASVHPVSEERFQSLPNELRLPATLCAELPWLEQLTSLQMTIDANIASLLDMITSCSRKWKDACKIILPKLMLMKSSLDSYQMKMTPVQFCYSITLCGLWHPAAANTFSQHWNEQGIDRLNTSVHSASRSIIKLLQTRAIPVATNTILAVR